MPYTTSLAPLLYCAVRPGAVPGDVLYHILYCTCCIVKYTLGASVVLSILLQVLLLYCTIFSQVHLLPSINPDGFRADTRHNVQDQDLNRWHTFTWHQVAKIKSTWHLALPTSTWLCPVHYHNLYTTHWYLAVTCIPLSIIGMLHVEYQYLAILVHCSTCTTPGGFWWKR